MKALEFRFNKDTLFLLRFVFSCEMNRCQRSVNLAFIVPRGWEKSHSTKRCNGRDAETHIFWCWIQTDIQTSLQDICSPPTQNSGEWNLATLNHSTSHISALPSACRTAEPADLVFLVDESWGVGQTSFSRVKDFISAIINSFQDSVVGSEGIRFGVTVYGDIPRSIWL